MHVSDFEGITDEREVEYVGNAGKFRELFSKSDKPVKGKISRLRLSDPLEMGCKKKDF